MTAAGWLRVFSWYVPERDTVAHAYLEHGIQSRSLCELARWNVLARRVKAGQPEIPALCPVCRAVVVAAAGGLLEEITDLDGGRAQEHRLPFVENEARGQWGDR